MNTKTTKELNELITTFQKIAQIQPQNTKTHLLLKWSAHKEKLEHSLTVEEKKDLNERLFSLSPLYGKLYDVQ